MAKDERNFIKRNGKIFYKTDVEYIYQCEDKTYAYRLCYKGANTFVTKDKNKQPIKRKSEAKELLLQDKREIDELKAKANAENEKAAKTIGDVWRDFYYSNQKEPNTIKKYKSIYDNHFIYSFDKITFQDITPNDINNYFETIYKYGDPMNNDLRDYGYSYSFVESMYKFFLLLIYTAYRSGVIDNARLNYLTDNMKMPKKTKADDNEAIRILTGEEIKQISEYLQNTDGYLPFLISLFCGTRPAETFALTFNDVDFDEMTITINKQIVDEPGGYALKVPKNKKPRTVPMPFIVANEIHNKKVLLEEIDKDPLKKAVFEKNRKRIIDRRTKLPQVIDMPLFLTMRENGTFFDVRSFGKQFNNYIKNEICHKSAIKPKYPSGSIFDDELIEDAYEEEFSFYTFRKTCLSNMAARNLPIGELMKFASHKKPETVYVYYYNTPDTIDITQESAQLNYEATLFGNVMPNF